MGDNMKAIAVLLCFIVSALGQGAGNFGYQCNTSPEAEWRTDEGCIKLDPGNNNIIDIRPCTNIYQSCPANTNPGTNEIQCESGTPFTPTPPKYGGLPGDPCRNNGDCKQLTSTCGMGYCTGVAKGGDCNVDQDCNPGSFCDASQTPNVCVAQLASGGTCGRDQQCMRNAGCNNKLCTLFYSLSASDVVTDCAATTSNYPNFPVGSSTGVTYSAFCQSGTCDPTGKSCSATISSNTKLPVQCTVANQATNCATSNGADGNLKSNTGCVLGFNPTGASYCQLDIGDVPYQNLINWIKNTWMPLVVEVSMQPYCNTYYRGINIQCLIRMGGQYLANQFTMLWKNAVNYPLYVGSDACTMQVFQSDYFGPQQYNLFCDTKFTCTNTTFTNNLSCIQETESNTFTIRSCTDAINPSCPPANFYATSTTEVQCIPSAPAAAPGTNLLPGDICSSNSQCLSNNCPYGTCVGLQSGQDCKVDTDCNPGLYCSQTVNPSVCTALIAAKAATTCTYDQQCAMNAACNIGTTGGNGICTAYYSVAVGETVSDCGSAGVFLKGGSTYVYYSNMCTSGTCELTTGTNVANYGTCVPAFQSASVPNKCTFLPTDCATSNSQKAVSNSQCSCSQTDGSRYCALDLGDGPFQDLMSWSNVYFSNFTDVYYSSMCHTNRRGYDQLCMQKVGGPPRVMQFTEKYNLAVNYQSIINALNCTLSVYQPQYWAAYQYNRPLKPDDINAAVGLLSIVATLFALAN